MRFLTLAAAFALFGFVLANAAISALVAVAWPWLRTRGLRSGALFVLRMLPSAGSAFLVMALVLPSFWLFEPRGGDESGVVALAVLAAAAVALAGAGLRRGAISWRETRRVERAWATAAVPEAHLGVAVPSYRIASDAPLAALVGVVRPRLFVTDGFLGSLSLEERQAVLDHEAAHLASRDNLKRLLMTAAPDWLTLTGGGDALEHAWETAAEQEADDRAAGPDRARALDVAGALLKAARLAPAARTAASHFSRGGPVGGRVSRLLAAPAPPPRHVLECAFGAGVVLAAMLLAGPMLHGVYATAEAAITALNYGGW